MLPPAGPPLPTQHEEFEVTVDLKMNVLIVDDYKTMLRIEDNLLRQIGFTNVEEALGGPPALEKLKQKKFGLILSDWNMEPMTGLEFLKVVRADPQTKSVPFIMVSAEGKAENVVAAKAAGVNNYIVKPFNAATLKQKIATVLGEF